MYRQFFVGLTVIFGVVESKSLSAGCKVLDLTHELSENTPYYPVYKPFNLTKSFAGRFSPEVEYVQYNFICSYEHMGTHIDGPSHFSKNGKKIDQVELDTMIGEACVLDISHKVNNNRDYYLTVDDIMEWEIQHGMLDTDSIVLLYTGQQHRYWDMKDYFGTSSDVSDPWTYHFSAFSGEAANFLVEKRRVKSVGVDAISLDGALAHDMPAHLNFLHLGKITGYENLNNLDQLPPRGATFFGAPLKIKDGSGSPVRAFALGWNGPNDPCGRRKMMRAEGKRTVANAFLLIVLLTMFFRISASQNICNLYL